MGQTRRLNLPVAGMGPRPPTVGAGFRIDGAAPGDQSGWKVSGVGDQNDDGYADIAITAPATTLGKAFIVYVRPDLKWLGLSTLDQTQGYEIDGITSEEHLGGSVADAGLNGDGRDDFAVADGGGDCQLCSGSVFVVW